MTEAKCGQRIRTLRFPDRADRATEVRTDVARISAYLPQAESQHNGEEGTFPDYPYQANYTKALPKIGNGRADVDPVAYVEAVRVLEEARQELAPDFSKIGIDPDDPTAPRLARKQTNPQSGVAFDLQGPDIFGVNLNLFREPARSMRPAPRIDGRDTNGNPDIENAAEMIELYWMALMRDIHFSDYLTTGAPVGAPPYWPGGNLAQQAAVDLDGIKNAFKETYPRNPADMVAPENLFRGSTPGDNVGPYISQFLLRGNTFFDFSNASPTVLRQPEDGLVIHGLQSGTLLLNQRQFTVVPFNDYLLDVSLWLTVQEGTSNPSGKDQYDPEQRFIRNLRDLGNWVHNDYLYQHFLNAALILLNEINPSSAPMSRFPLDPGNPYTTGQPNSVNQTGFATFGQPHVLTLLAEVTTRALKAVWYQKWYVHRRNRPEEFGGLIHFEKMARNEGNPTGPYPCIDSTILNANVLNLIFQRNAQGGATGTYLLPQVFPEGSPTHPAYASGHATVAGACATILKAFFDEKAPMTNPGNTIPTDTSRLPVAFVANANGTALEPAPAPEQVELCVGGELNKLASNISIGRNGAGVHWRSDATQGMALGEAMATGILFEQAFTFNERHSLSFTTFFTNEVVTIGREGTATGDVVFVRIADPMGTIVHEEQIPVL